MLYLNIKHFCLPSFRVITVHYKIKRKPRVFSIKYWPKIAALGNLLPTLPDAKSTTAYIAVIVLVL